jgi:cation diffusion facilitator CzcD-associated flavoprotein CzcO
MPRGMYLKSPGHGSSLSDPAGTHTLGAFCMLAREPHGRWKLPVPVDQFVRYGQWFQKELVPNLDERNVVTCNATGDGFLLELEGGEKVAARSVVVASGFRHSARMPPELQALPKELVSHSSAHQCFEPLSGRDVVVIGAGQSALEGAALLREAGGSPTLLARRENVSWNPALPDVPRLDQRIRRPDTGLGVGWKYVFYTHKLRPFYYLPRDTRHRLVATTLGPSGAHWLRDRVVGRVPMMLGWTVSSARERSGKVVLRIQRGEETSEVRADHVIAATGYQVTPHSFPFLGHDLRSRIVWDDGSPALSRNFESTVPGLHFTGLAAAKRFGPVMRFVDGVHPSVPPLAKVLASRFRR